jgi:hypothetical protein
MARKKKTLRKTGTSAADHDQEISGSKKKFIEVRYSQAEIARRVNRLHKAAAYPLSYAQLFLREPVFYGTNIITKSGGEFLIDPRRAKIATNGETQIYRMGVTRIAKPILIDRQKYLISWVPAPAFADNYLSAQTGEKLLALTCEESAIIRAYDTDFIDLNGNELAYNFCMLLQFEDLSTLQKLKEEFPDDFPDLSTHREKYEAHHKAFQDDALKFLEYRLKLQLRKNRLFAADFEDALAQTFSTPPEDIADEDHVEEADRSFPTFYPFGKEIIKYQVRVTSFLTTIAQTAAKWYYRDAQRKRDRQDLRVLDDPELDMEISNASSKIGGGSRAFHPFYDLCLKDALKRIREILPEKRLWAALKMRVNLGYTDTQIAAKRGVSKTAIHKDFKLIKIKAGPVAVRALSKMTTVKEFEASLRVEEAKRRKR